MRATSESIEGNKVRLSVEVDESEVDTVLEEAVRSLSRQARVPGFRPGKVPRRVLEARMGGAVALRGEALREALPDLYARAVVDTSVDPITQPDIDITGGQESGPFTFDAVVEVRPKVAIPGYAGLRVTLPSLSVSDEDVDVQIDRLRENDGELVTVERPAIDGDHVTVNIHGYGRSGEELIGADDFLYEVGSGTVVPELDQQLRGSKPGDVLVFDATAPTPGAEPGGGQTVSFRVLVKEVKEKRLPKATDEWASESSEFSTLAELRADLASRLAQAKQLQARLALRENALSALIDLVDDEEIPEVLVAEEVGERAHDLAHRLEDQGIALEQFLTVTGRSPESLTEELRLDARRAVKVDLALRALADAEELEVSDDELATDLASMAERMNVDAAELRRRLDRTGRIGAVRSEQRKAKALAWLLDHVELVDEDGNELTREDLGLGQESDEPAGEGEATTGEANGQDLSGAASKDATTIDEMTEEEGE